MIKVCPARVACWSNSGVNWVTETQGWPMTSWPSQEGNRPRLLGLAGTKLHCTTTVGQEFTKTSRDGISEYASQTASMFETICRARYLHEY